MDGVALQDKDANQMLQLIVGAPGSEAALEIMRAGKPMKSRALRTGGKPSIYNKEIIKHNKMDVGYFAMSSFMSMFVGEEIKKFIQGGEQHTSNPGYILDLRGNGGGYTNLAVDIAGFFLPKGSLVATLRNTSNGDIKGTYKTNIDPITEKPLVILVDEKSASASEFLSGALKEYSRAYIVGKRTFGKGSEQKVKIYNKYSKKNTIKKAETHATFHQPSGRSNQSRGVTPHLDVERFPELSGKTYKSLREGDLYPTAHRTPEIAEPSAKAELRLKSVESCIATEGQAKKLYDSLPLYEFKKDM